MWCLFDKGRNKEMDCICKKIKNYVQLFIVVEEEKMYDPTTARFLQPDPLGNSEGGANLYQYCLNDPINRIDPSGFQPLEIAPPPREAEVTWKPQRGPGEPLGKYKFPGQTWKTGA